MIKNININNNYSNDNINLELTEFINKSSENNLSNYKSGKSETSKSRNSRSGKSKSRNSRSGKSKSRNSRSINNKSETNRLKNSRIKCKCNNKIIYLQKINIDNVSMYEIKEFLLLLDIIKSNNNTPNEILKYIYKSIVYDNININKY